MGWALPSSSADVCYVQVSLAAFVHMTLVSGQIQGAGWFKCFSGNGASCVTCHPAAGLASWQRSHKRAQKYKLSPMALIQKSYNLISGHFCGSQ